MEILEMRNKVTDIQNSMPIDLIADQTQTNKKLGNCIEVINKKIQNKSQRDKGMKQRSRYKKCKIYNEKV